MAEHPLSGLAKALSDGDLTAAAVLVNQAPWTNLANALRALPEPDRFTAYRLLRVEAADQLREQLIAPEQADLDRARTQSRRGFPSMER